MNITMPQLGLTMEEGTLEVWFKEEGDYLRRGDVVAEISTDKATTELEAPDEGVLEKILVEVGTTVPVGATLALLRLSGEAQAETTQAREPAVAEVEPVPTSTTIQLIEVSSNPVPTLIANEEDEIVEPAIKASPLARRLARENKLDIMLLAGQGSGPGGRVVEQDVLNLVAQQPSVSRNGLAQDIASSFELVPLSPVRAVTARRLLDSARTTVPVTLSSEVDVTRLVRLREEIINDPGFKDLRVTYTDLIGLALGRTLPRHPSLNSTFLDSAADGKPALKVWQSVNLGLAIALEGEQGLVVPVINSVQNLSLPQFTRQRQTLVRKAREKLLGYNEMEGATFSLSNLGQYAVDSFNPVINLPQVAILGVGRITRRPGFNRQGQVRPRHFLTLSLTFDHRAVDGAPAAAFLTDLVALLEKPLSLIITM